MNFDSSFSDHALIYISIVICTGHLPYTKPTTHQQSSIRKINNREYSTQIDYKKTTEEQWTEFQNNLIDTHNDWSAHQPLSLRIHESKQNHVDHLYTILEGQILKNCKSLTRKKTLVLPTDFSTTSEIRHLNNILYHLNKTINNLKRW